MKTWMRGECYEHYDRESASSGQTANQETQFTKLTYVNLTRRYCRTLPMSIGKRLILGSRFPTPYSLSTDVAKFNSGFLSK